MRFYWLLLGSLAVWRVTHLLNAEDGPGNVLAELRRRAGVGFWGSLLDCFYCLSLWIALPFSYYMGEGWRERILLWLAFSGAASLLERITSHEHHAPPALYAEDREGDNVLRQEQGTIPGNNSQHPST